jgi:hypothetical protein
MIEEPTGVVKNSAIGLVECKVCATHWIAEPDSSGAWKSDQLRCPFCFPIGPGGEPTAETIVMSTRIPLD